MSSELIEYGYQVQDRGDRVAPRRSQRNYHTLVGILDRLQKIVDSELFLPGERILDYGCGGKPYESLFRMKFRHYVGADIAGNAEANLAIEADGHVPAEDKSFDC